MLPPSMDNRAASPVGPIGIILPIERMTCASCVNRIERS